VQPVVEFLNVCAALSVSNYPPSTKTTQNYVILNINNLNLQHNRSTPEQDSVLTDIVHNTIQETLSTGNRKRSIENVNFLINFNQIRQQFIPNSNQVLTKYQSKELKINTVP
jgi:hypothetical protein